MLSAILYVLDGADDVYSLVVEVLTSSCFFSPGMLNRTSIPYVRQVILIFLLRVALFTLIKMKSFIVLVKSCLSKPTMLKSSVVV